ncbi:MAG: cell division protein FtsA, partial [Thermus sp.]
RIIRPRLREILHLARSSVDEALGPLEVTVNRVVLTGGGAMMRGLDTLARTQYNLPVRIGKPTRVGGLLDVVASPAHAAAVGLVRYGTVHQGPQPKESRSYSRREAASGEGFWKRIKEILSNLF